MYLLSEYELSAIVFLQKAIRNYWVRKYLCELIKALPTQSPIDSRWPICPKHLEPLNNLIKCIYHKWRCYKYRKKLNTQLRAKLHEKSVASSLFKNKKSSYFLSIGHEFIGDYIKLRLNPKWQKIIDENLEHYIVFADLIFKINKKDGHAIQKLLVLTTKGLFILEPKTLDLSYSFLSSEIYQINLSPYYDGLIAFNMKMDTFKHAKDYILYSSHAIELSTKIYLLSLNYNELPIIVNVNASFSVTNRNDTMYINVVSNQPPYLHHEPDMSSIYSDATNNYTNYNTNFVLPSTNTPTLTNNTCENICREGVCLNYLASSQPYDTQQVTYKNLSLMFPVIKKPSSNHMLIIV